MRAVDVRPPRAHFGTMAPGPFRKVWLALLLLVATFSSAPLGSMEQAELYGSQGEAQASSVPAVRPDRSLRVEKVQTVPDPPPPVEVYQPSPPSPRSGRDAGASPTGKASGRPARACDSRTRPLCERLPYDPNAPPSGSA